MCKSTIQIGIFSQINWAHPNLKTNAPKRMVFHFLENFWTLGLFISIPFSPFQTSWVQKKDPESTQQHRTNVHQEGTSSNNHESSCTSKLVDHHVAHTQKHQILYQIFSNDIVEDPMSYNATPKECKMHQNNKNPCVLSSKKWIKNFHQNLNQIRSKENVNTSSVSKKSHKHTHEYVYHQEIKKDVSSINNVLQSYTSSTKCWMKFLHNQMD